MLPTLAKKNESASENPSLALVTLEALPHIAANSLIGLCRTVTVEQYKYFLNMMYHYTMPSEELLAEAAKKMPNDDLKDFFEHQSKDERGHYRMAREDLSQGFGEKVTEKTPAAIENYKIFWRSLQPHQALAYLGAVFLFENVATLAQDEAVALLKRLNLESRQTTWVRVHLEADVEHGGEARRLVEKYLPTDHQGMITYGAVQGCNLWTKIFQEAFFPN